MHMGDEGSYVGRTEDGCETVGIHVSLFLRIVPAAILAVGAFVPATAAELKAKADQPLQAVLTVRWRAMSSGSIRASTRAGSGSTGR